MTRTAGEIAELLGAELSGDPDVSIERIRPLQTASSGELTFLLDGRDPPPAAEIGASAVIVQSEVDGDLFPEGTVLLRVENAYASFARALEIFDPEPPAPFQAIDPSAHVHPEASLGADVSIAAEVVVGAGAQIGDGCVLYPGVTVGESCVLGKQVVLHPRVTVYPRCEIGDRSIVHAGAVIGCDGFGYAPAREGNVKIHHKAIVRLGTDVEIGANTTIDRGVLDDTVIGNGTKIDNLVHLGHNTVIGEHCLVAGLTGMAGSCTVGNRVMIAGQVGLGGHLHVGDGAQIGAKSGVHRDVPGGQKMLGIPATDIQTARRAYAMLYRLPELRQYIDKLAKRLDELTS